MVKVTSPLTSRKQGFFFYLTKLKSDILLDVYKKKILKSHKAFQLFTKMYFQLKVTLWKRCQSR